MPALTRQAVFAAVNAKFPNAKSRAALTQKLGKPWSHASTEALARAVGMQSAPRTTAQSKNAARATASRHGVAKSFAAESAAHRLNSNPEQKTALKQRIVRSVNRELKAHEKAVGRKLTPDEKRKIAVKALHGEVQAIKAGRAEAKPAGRKKAHQMNLAEYAAARHAPKHVVKEVAEGDRHSPEASQLLAAHRKAVAKAIDAGHKPAAAAIGEHGREFLKTYHYRSRAEDDLKAGKPVPASVVAAIGKEFPGFAAKYGEGAEGKRQKVEGKKGKPASMTVGGTVSGTDKPPQHIPQAAKQGKTTTKAVKAEKLSGFKTSTGEAVDNAEAYGSLVLALSRAGNNTYAKIYDRKTGKIVVSLSNQPVNGQIKQIKTATAALASRHDFGNLSAYSSSEQTSLGLEVRRAFSPESLKGKPASMTVGETVSGTDKPPQHTPQAAKATAKTATTHTDSAGDVHPRGKTTTSPSSATLKAALAREEGKSATPHLDAVAQATGLPKKAIGAAAMKMKEKVATVKPPETKAALPDNPKRHSIKTQAEFDDLALHVHQKLNAEGDHGGLVPIYKIRRAIGDLVPRDKFNAYMFNKFQPIGGEMPGLTIDKGRDSIETKLGGVRYYAKPDDPAAVQRVKGKHAEMEKLLQNRPELDPLGTARSLSQGKAITNQDEFEKTVKDAHKRLDEEFNHSNLVPIARVREALGDRVKPEAFDKMLGTMQANDKTQLIGRNLKEGARDDLDAGAWKGMLDTRHYMKMLS